MSQTAVSDDKRPALAFDNEQEADALIDAINEKQKTLTKQVEIEYFDKLKSQLKKVTWLFQYAGYGDE